MSTAFDHTFDTLIDRTGTGSLKWDDMERIFGPVPQNAIPLWVADMDFHAPEAVQNAVKDVAAQGIYGYPAESSAPREAAATWLADRHGWAPGKESLVTVPGVVPGMALLIRELTAPGDGVAVQPPVYPPLFDCVRAAGRRVVENPLVETDGRWGMDLGGLEGIFKGGVRLLLLCSPHNPVGRVWTRDELSALADLCQRYGVMVVADEIHHDLVLPGHTHTVFASLPQCQPDRVVTCVSASKSFNLGGLPHAYVVATDGALRQRIAHAVVGRGLAHGDLFGMVAQEAAHRHGAPWLDALRMYIADNAAMLQDRLHSHLPWVRMATLEGTYLAWLDCRASGMDETTMMRRLVAAGVVPSGGRFFGTGGEGHLRVNLATPRTRLLAAIARMIVGLA